jgi:hypothetical protein
MSEPSCEKVCHSRSTIRGVLEAGYAGVLPQYGMNDFPLDADAAPVNDPDFPVALEQGLIQVFFDHIRHFLRLKRVQIDGIFYRNRFRGHNLSRLACAISMKYYAAYPPD